MKKIIFFLMMLIPLNVLAYTGPLDDEYFNINNQTSSPYSISIGSNSTTDVTFKLDYFWTHSVTPSPDLPGSYLFVSIESNKKLDIYRKYNFGSNCSSSCFSNDDYLYLVNDDNGFSYVYYFNIVKWSRIVGTQVDQFSISDVFTFKNLESGTASVYLYGSFANITNEIPNFIDNVETRQQIIIGNESIESTLNQNTQDIINNLTNDCNNLLDINGLIGGQLSNYNNDYKIIKVDNSNRFSSTGSIALIPGNYYISCNIIENHADNIRFQFMLNGTTKRYATCNNTFDLTSDVNQVRMYLSDDLSNGSYIIFNNVKIESGTSPTTYCPFGSKSNKIDDTTKAINDTNQSINDMNDTIKDSNIDSPNSDFSTMEGMIADNGVITNLITLPITLYQAILNSVNGTCSNYSFGQLYGTDITFSCISLQTLLGNTIFSVIDILFSGFTIYKIAKKMIKVFNNMSSLKEGDVLDD